MKRVFVAGHGNDPRDPEVYVPPRVTLHFHADVDTAALQALSLAVLATGASGGSIQQYGPGERLPNYLLASFNDWEMAARLTVAEQESELLLVGDIDPLAGRVGLPSPIQLCHTPEMCGKGQHFCDGVLGLLSPGGHDVRGVGDDEIEIHILTCRVRSGSRNYGITRRLAGESVPGSFRLQASIDVENVLKLARADAADNGTRAEKLFDALPPERQAILLSYFDVKLWSYNRHARALLHNYGDRKFYHFHVGQPEEDRYFHLQDPQLAAAIARARADYLQEIPARTNGKAVFLKTLPAAVLQDLYMTNPPFKYDVDTLVTSHVGMARSSLTEATYAFRRYIDALQDKYSAYEAVLNARESTTRLIAQYVEVLAEIHAASDDSTGREQAEMQRQEVMKQLSHEFDALHRAEGFHKVHHDHDASNEHRIASGNAWKTAMAMIAKATNSLGLKSVDQASAFTKLCRTFTDTFRQVHLAVGIAEDTFLIVVGSYEDMCLQAMSREEVEDIRRVTEGIGGGESAHAEFHHWEEETRAEILAAATPSLDAIAHMRTALTEYFTVLDEQLLVLVSAQAAFDAAVRDFRSTFFGS